MQNEIKKHIEEKLPKEPLLQDFGCILGRYIYGVWNRTYIMVAFFYGDYEHSCVFSIAWRNAITNPRHIACKNRLLREFNEWITNPTSPCAAYIHRIC